MARLSGQTTGPYRIRELLGMGGVAEVYRVEHRDGSQAALKVLKRELLGEADKVRSISVEASRLARLEHPAIPALLEELTVDQRPAFLMTLMPGETLAALQAQRAILPGPALLRQTIAIAAYLHRQDLVHNDLKLENLLLGPEGTLSLVDFGNCREVRLRVITRFFLKRHSQIFGTATYLAPELIRGDAPTPSSDVYALGIIAWLLLAGRPPFPEERQSGRLRAHLNAAPPSIRSALPQLPPLVVTAIDACLQKLPERRPSDAVALHAALKDWGMATVPVRV